MIHNILNKLSFKENKRRYLNLKGIFSRCYAYKAPDVVQIDLTDRCNSHCLVCWLHSPFINKDINSNTNDLDFTILKNFIKDIAKTGTKEIIFSGGGEPFLYPHIWEILEFTQKLNLKFRINTNFILLDKNSINRLLSFNNLLSLTISIWAGEASLYSKLHNRDTDVFLHIKNNLKFLNIVKTKSLYVKIFVVVNNLNYARLEDLITLSTETGCDAIEFGVPDVIPGITDSFLLSKEQLAFLKQDYMRIIKNINRKNNAIKIVNNNIFLRRISNPGAPYGEYDSVVEGTPCYAGWIFLRLRANGDFNSCLKSHSIPIGNIYRDTFTSVWNNCLQQEFRKKSLHIPKEKSYFRFIGNSSNEDIGCKRICDNIVSNEHLYKIIQYLSSA